MKDYVIELKIKNNLLESKMKEHGILTGLDLTRKSGVTTVSQMLNLKMTLYTPKLDIRIAWVKLAEFFNCEPHELCPESIYIDPINDNRGRVHVDAEQMYALSSKESDPVQLIGNSETCDHLMDILTDRQRNITQGVIDGVTLDELGQEYGICGPRVGQIHAYSLRKMRRLASLEDIESGLLD